MSFNSSRLFVTRICFVSKVYKLGNGCQIGRESNSSNNYQLVYRLNNDKFVLFGENKNIKVKTENDILDMHEYFVDTFTITPLKEFAHNLNKKESAAKVNKLARAVNNSTFQDELIKNINKVEKAEEFTLR